MSLKIINLSKSFGDKKIFSSFSYEFSDVGLYSPVGESGIGKTTLLRMIAGLDKDYVGEISGVSSVSFAFQEYRLFPQLSALDNLIYAISDKKDEAVCNKCKTMLQRLGFCERDMHLLPRQMSGGMKQRVSLARAFLYDSPILLLDEPTKELDSENAALVCALIEENAKERLVIAVSHNINELNNMNSTLIQL